MSIQNKEAVLKVHFTPRNKENHEHKMLIFFVSFFALRSLCETKLIFETAS
jgi:hypothetical protein